MKPNEYERELSRVLCLLEEFQTGKKIDPFDWEGNHPNAYNHATKERLDTATATLCAALTRSGVEGRSLEMQMWWRDHQEADRIRLENERRREEARTIEKISDAELVLRGLWFGLIRLVPATNEVAFGGVRFSTGDDWSRFVSMVGRANLEAAVSALSSNQISTKNPG